MFSDKTVFQSVFPPAVCHTSYCFPSSAAFGGVGVLDFVHSKRHVVLFHCFNLQFPKDIFLHLHVFFGEVSVQSFFSPMF